MSTASTVDSPRNNSRIIPISFGSYNAEIATFGGGVRNLSFDHEPIMDGYGEYEFPPLSANVVLAPWPNRTGDGRYSFNGEEHVLALTEPLRHNAIHGLVCEREWTVEQRSDQEAVLAIDVPAQQGWPWELSIKASYRLSESGLRCSTRITNQAATACPAAYGFHSYLNAFGAPIDECCLELPAATVLPLDSVRKLPAGAEVPAQTVLDPDGTVLGKCLLDHCFHASESTEWRVTRLGEASGKKVELRTCPELAWFQVFTADPSWTPEYPGRGRALAVEPMTVPPNALRSGIDLVSLDPGESLTVAWEVGVSLGKEK